MNNEPGILDLCVRKFYTESNNPFYMFFKRASSENINNTGINFPLFVLTEMEFDSLLNEMNRQRKKMC